MIGQPDITYCFLLLAWSFWTEPGGDETGKWKEAIVLHEFLRKPSIAYPGVQGRTPLDCNGILSIRCNGVNEDAFPVAPLGGRPSDRVRLLFSRMGLAFFFFLSFSVLLV